MSFKTIALGFAIPQITSTTKAPKARATKRATVLPSTTRAASSRSLSHSWVGYASVFGIAGVVVSFGFYVYMTNAYATKGFELKRQQALITDLTEKLKLLTVQQAELGSIGKVNEIASIAGMVPVTGEEFINNNHLSQR